MTSTEPIAQRARRFRALHDQGDVFVLPNPWDVGSARLLETAGFAALATTSAGYAASAGVPDGHPDGDSALTHIGEIAAATNLPLSADLEGGYAIDPASVAATIAAAGRAGAVGGSIEDIADDGQLLPLGLAVERIAAAVAAARALPFDFVLTARCESMLTSAADLNVAVERLQAYQTAGADVLYAPGLTTREQVAAVVSSVDRPVNVVMGLGGATMSVDELGDLGVRRISLGSALARAAYGALLRAVDEITTTGTFEFAASAVPYARLNALLAPTRTGG